MNNYTSQGINIESSFWSFDLSFELVFSFIVWILVLFVLFSLAKKIARWALRKDKYINYTIFQIRLPKGKPGEEKDEPSIAELREDISLGETLFSSIGNLRARRGFKSWL